MNSLLKCPHEDVETTFKILKKIGMSSKVTSNCAKFHSINNYPRLAHPFPPASWGEGVEKDQLQKRSEKGVTYGLEL